MGTWKILNCVINKHLNTPIYPDIFMTNNKPLSEKREIAIGFNFFFFTNGGPNLAKYISLSDNDVSI